MGPMTSWTILRFVAGSLAAACCFGAIPASAQEDPVAAVKRNYPVCQKEATEADVTAAAGAHRAAMQAFDRFQFEQAVRLWTDAYTFDCSRPKVFINLGQAYERDGNKAGALAVYELLLERSPSDAPSDLQAKVEALRAAVKTEAEERAKAEAAKAAAARADKPAEPPPESGPPLGVAPWVGVGVGGAAVIAGGVLLGVGLTQASSAADECADPAERTGCAQESIDDGEAGETMSMAGQGLLYAGGGVLALSLVLQFVVNTETPTAPAAESALAPVVGPGISGLVYRTRF